MAIIQQQLNNNVKNIICVKTLNSNLDDLTLKKICGWGLDYFELLENTLNNLDSSNKQIIIAHQSNLLQEFTIFISNIVDEHFNNHNKINIDILINLIDKVGHILGPNYISPDSSQCNIYLKQIHLIEDYDDLIISLRRLLEINSD